MFYELKNIFLNSFCFVRIIGTSYIEPFDVDISLYDFDGRLFVSEVCNQFHGASQKEWIANEIFLKYQFIIGMIVSWKENIQ